jgi:hypothetical protein
MTPSVRLAVALAVAILVAATAAADVVFPARLAVAETEPGRYQVTFTLPIVEGRVLRAMPSMPPTCRDATDRERVAALSGITTSWSVACEPASLAGEAVLVEGLLGTQIELAFGLTTLDGRVFNAMLKPSRPGFLVPPPPSPAALVASAGGAGVRWALVQVQLWLLMLVVALGGVRARTLGWGIMAFAVAAAISQWLVSRGWMNASVPVSEAFVLLTAAAPSVGLAGGGEGWRGWLRPLWPVMLLIGALTAGAGTNLVQLEGLSRGEQLAAFGLFAVGSAVGLAWSAAIAVELRAVLAAVSQGRWLVPATRLLATGLGAVAVGMLLVRLVGLSSLVQGFPAGALAPVVAAVGLAPLLAAAGAADRIAAPLLIVAAAVGLAGGLARIDLPLGDLLVPALLLALSLPLLLGRIVPTWLARTIAAASAAACCWSGTLALTENVSRSAGTAVATVVVAAAVLLVGLSTVVNAGQSALAALSRIAGAGVALWVVLDRLAEYRVWFEREVATASALGLLRVPLLALALVAVAALLWPRRRRVLDELGIRRRSTAWHWVAVVAAFLALPYGTVTVPNPLHEPRAPRGDDARRVASSVLFDTYSAFNLTDEEEVFDRLAKNVTGNLVDDLYLDSRRRLTAGTREGTEVTVRDVSVIEIGDPVEAEGGGAAVTYDCRWVVTSRVRHLQHIHHRRNIYGGALTLSIDGGRWKIADVELVSEDRIVVPGVAS